MDARTKRIFHSLLDEARTNKPEIFFRVENTLTLMIEELGEERFPPYRVFCPSTLVRFTAGYYLQYRRYGDTKIVRSRRPYEFGDCSQFDKEHFEGLAIAGYLKIIPFVEDDLIRGR